MAEGVTHEIKSKHEDKAKGTFAERLHFLHKELRPSENFSEVSSKFKEVSVELKGGEIHLKLGSRDKAAVEIRQGSKTEEMTSGKEYKLKLGEQVSITSGTETLTLTLKAQRVTTEDDLNEFRQSTVQTVAPIKVDVKENLDSLFALDVKIAESSTSVLPLGTKEELLDFLTSKHKSETWEWKDSQGTLVGYISIVDKPEEGAMEVLNLGVDPDFRRKGYAKQMMEFAEELAIENGRKKVTLVTNIKNLPAIDFYKSVGYSVIKEIPNYYGDGETRDLFEKILVGRVQTEVPPNLMEYALGGISVATKRLEDDEEYLLLVNATLQGARFRELYTNVLKRATVDGVLRKDLLLWSTYVEVAQAIPHQSSVDVDNLIKQKEQKVNLEDILENKVGVCRHDALACSSLLYRLKLDGHLAGTIYLENDMVTVVKGDKKEDDLHAWCRYVRPDGKEYVLDVAQGFYGTLEEAMSRFNDGHLAINYKEKLLH